VQRLCWPWATPEITALKDRLLGTWVTAPVPFDLPGGQAFVRRTATFWPDRERLVVEAFADEAMTQPLLTYDSEGPIEVVGPWDNIPGAFAAELQNERSEVTVFADLPQMWATVNLGNCPLAVNTAVDITTCASGPPFQVTDCTDLEVIFISEDNARLQLSGGDGNRCEKRPEVLSELVFTRQ
jgi:hypothetical protein